MRHFCRHIPENKRGAVSILVLLSSLLLLSAQPDEHSNSAWVLETRTEKPNIIFICSDDQRFNTIGALGGRGILTPHLDSLVAFGTTFTHAFNMGAWHGAVCVASRTMLLTGLSVWRAQEAEKSLSEMVATSGLWSQHLKGAGYETYMSGKWHVRTDVNDVFDHVKNERPGMPNQTSEGYYRPQSREDTTWTPWNKKFEGFWKGGKHWSEVLADDASQFLAQARQDENPFFIYLAFNAPHDPRQSPKEYVDLYPLEKISLPESYMDDYPYKEEMGAGTGLRDEQLAPFPRTPYAVKKHIQEYYASITHMDAQVGKIMQALKETGKLHNTYVFFTSDHGLAVGHHGLMGKQSMFDHSLRVPLIVAGPGIPSGEKREQPVYLQDIMATTYELAGLKKPNHVFFNSLMPLIKDRKSGTFYPEIYGGYMNRQRMVRTQRHKLIVYPETGRMLLFDLRKDPQEIRDVSGDPHYQSAMKDMLSKLEHQQQELNDPLDLSGVLQGDRTAIQANGKGKWESLFDGRNLDKWKSASTNGPPNEGWVIDNGVLSVVSGRTGGDIITRDTYEHFEFKLEFQLTESANSGIKYLVNRIQNVNSNKSSLMGVEYQIIDDFNYPAVKNNPNSVISTGSVYLLYPPENKKLNPPGQWNDLMISVQGDHVEHWLNGVKVAAYERNSKDFLDKVAQTKFRDYPEYARARKGHILIQDHGDKVSFRNIMIRRLD